MTLCLSLLSLLSCSHGIEWKDGPSLPRVDHEQAIAYYSDSLWIFGGECKDQAIIEYSLHNNTLINHGFDAIGSEVHGGAQFWTQINNKLYLKANEANVLRVFNLTILDSLSVNVSIEAELSLDAAVSAQIYKDMPV